MKLSLSEDKQSRLITYIELLHKWNKVHNLTAVRDPEEMISRHILDSLTALPFLEENTSVCDVGTGAGLPGLILAIANPTLKIKLIDSQHKKISFVQHAILNLSLTNVQAICDRIERFQTESIFDWIISRAFASLSDFIQQTTHLADEKTRWLAMKGKLSDAELAAIPPGLTIEKSYAVSVPNLVAERHLLVLKKSMA